MVRWFRTVLAERDAIVGVGCDVGGPLVRAETRVKSGAGVLGRCRAPSRRERAVRCQPSPSSIAAQSGGGGGWTQPPLPLHRSWVAAAVAAAGAGGWERGTAPSTSTLLWAEAAAPAWLRPPPPVVSTIGAGGLVGACALNQSAVFCACRLHGQKRDRTCPRMRAFLPASFSAKGARTGRGGVSNPRVQSNPTWRG